MADRVSVVSGGVTGTVAPAGPRVARFIVAGQTQMGPSAAPEVCRSMREFQTKFGARSGGPNVWDAAEFFFANRAGELVVQRATGPGAVRATASLDAGKITVTARNVGAYYNAWTAAYTTSTKTLTVQKGALSASYSGADAAALQAAASADADVLVTVSSLPASNVVATALASGTDDFANVSWASVLGRVPLSVGPGAIAVPGVAAAASAVAAAGSPRRFGLVSSAMSDTAAQAVTAQGALSGVGRQFSSVCFPWGWVADGAGGVKPLDGAVYGGTLRAVTQRTFGVGVSPLLRAAHRLVSGFVPMVEVDDSTHTTLEAAGVITARTLAGGVGCDVWATADGVNGNPDLKDGRFRDLTNAITDECAVVLDGFVGMGAGPDVLSQAESALKGVLERYVPWLTGGDGAGYRVGVSNGVDPADNRIGAQVAVRFTESVNWIDLAVTTAAADQSI